MRFLKKISRLTRLEKPRTKFSIFELQATTKKRPLLYLSFTAIFFLVLSNSLFSGEPTQIRQQVVQNMCTTALKTGDLGTIDILASEIINWTGLEDEFLIDTSILCLEKSFGKKFLYDREKKRFLKSEPLQSEQDILTSIKNYTNLLRESCNKLLKINPEQSIKQNICLFLLKNN